MDVMLMVMMVTDDESFFSIFIDVLAQAHYRSHLLLR